MQQRLAEKEKANKEEHLRMLAQKAREGRSGGVSTLTAAAKPSAAGGVALQSSLGQYGDSDSESRSGSDKSEDEDSGDDGAARLRDKLRREKRQDREREMRMSNMGTEQRMKQLARSVSFLFHSRMGRSNRLAPIVIRQSNRDISEKVALGLAKPTLSKESMLDSRLFNRESLPNSFADNDAYNLYDKPLFHGSTAVAAIYKSRGNLNQGTDEQYGGGTEEGITKALDNDRFGLGTAGKHGFEGADLQEATEGPVQFEKDNVDVFGVDSFLDQAKRGQKRGLDTDAYAFTLYSLFSTDSHRFSSGGDRKRRQLDRAGDRD